MISYIEATLIDNGISICYILLYLYYGTLPWMVASSRAEEIRLKKEFNERELSPDTPIEIGNQLSFHLFISLHYDYSQ